eukprot:CAMPEP_0179920790 /NCGR_PEP_ID=MMETSP0983-20121128/4723_1 /TAXON_ID=483367 /ORGANISM="non described non described, Strain CCMP 2436" /LENGTH=348 /DNA_ID=CAMNT_0021823953 /DNA_START=92 /DNA_END=1139 /DNA_ORIENTATION=-
MKVLLTPFGLYMRAAAGGLPLLLALNFKQMSLYYAPAFFCHMLGLCLSRPTWRGRAGTVLALGLVVVGTFVLCWLPFLAGGAPAVRAVLSRLFPVQRGLYEDKVANVWCTLSVLPGLKLRANASASHALRLSLAAVLASLGLPAASMLRRPSERAFELGLVCCALSFFLFSFQVHEKHILLALAPASALLGEAPVLVGWLCAIGCFSMFPLLERDGLAIAYVGGLAVLCALVAAARALAPADRDTDRDADRGLSGENWLEGWLRAGARALPLLVSGSALGMGALHAAAALVRAPARYPDLHQYLFCAYACAHFCTAWLALQAWHACHLLGWRYGGECGGRHALRKKGN